MNKRALIGMILLFVAAIFLIVGALIYFQVRNHGLQIISGKFIIDLDITKQNKTDFSYNTTQNYEDKDTGNVSDSLADENSSFVNKTVSLINNSSQE